MIVLDEQLLGRGLERDIAHWYRGTVQFITDSDRLLDRCSKGVWRGQQTRGGAAGSAR